MNLLTRIQTYTHQLAAILMVVLVAAQVGVPMSAFAASSTFTTSLTTFNGPVVPPSIPTGLSAAPVSSSQIDLIWNPSTAGTYMLAGYRILRDSVFLATTTGTSYSDIGLSAETTYSYEVEAFDTQYTLSGLSASTSATTLSAPITPTSTPIVVVGTGSGSSGYVSNTIVISDVSITSGTTHAQVSFSTNVPTQAKIFWGTSPDFEKGTISSLVYGTHHELVITGLDAGTVYYVRIQVANNVGTVAIADTTFATAPLVTEGPLANPSNFRAIDQNGTAALSWANPLDPRFASVRIIKSDRFFPKDQNDGMPIYDGRGSSFIDRDVEMGKTYYYAIFSKGNDGSFSSGAVALVRISLPGEAPSASTDPFASLGQSSIIDPMINILAFADFQGIQGGSIITRRTPTSIYIDGSENLTITLPYAKVPEVLKTIALTLTDPRDASKTFTFLLRVNSTRTAYQATIAPLGTSGIFPVAVTVLDYQNLGLKRIKGNFVSSMPVSEVIPVRAPDTAAIILIILLVVPAFFLIFWKRRKEEEESDETHS